MDANQLKELTEYFDSRYVQKDTGKDYITDGCILIEVEGVTA